MKKQKSGGSFRTKGETIVAKAIRTVPGFGDTYRKFEQQTTLEQGSKSALQNYGRSIAKIANHFGVDPRPPPDQLLLAWNQRSETRF